MTSYDRSTPIETEAFCITNPPLSSPKGEDLIFIFYKDQILLKKENYTLPKYKDIISLIAPLSSYLYIGEIDKKPHFAVQVQSLPPNSPFLSFTLRELIRLKSEKFFYGAGRAYQLTTWLIHNKFCGCCGHPMEMLTKEQALSCPSCSNLQYPRISPAIIVAVTKGESILLAKSSGGAYKNYSVLAGFVEPGESLEAAVHREVFEECGIKVKNLRYFSSQPWPFPHTLMCGFLAQWAHGEINIDPKEIATASWFKKSELPELPHSFSISRRLIDEFLRGTP